MKIKSFDALAERIASTNGLSVSELINMTPDETTEYIEKRSGKRVVAKSFSPTVGRGNILTDRSISRDAINNEIDEILA
jgi:hypothetical protein